MIKHLKGLEINSIYDFDNAFSINELLCKFWEKIEETINISNESIDILNWVKEQGLADELQVLINQLVADGTIEQMINVDKIEELRTTIEEIQANVREQLETNANDIKNIAVSVKKFNADDTGVDDTSESFKNANTYNNSVYVANGTFRISTNTNIGTLVVGKNGYIIIDENTTLTVDSVVCNKSQLVFKGNGKVSIKDNTYSVAWYEGNTVNKKWDFLRKDFESGKPYTVVFPVPSVNDAAYHTSTISPHAWKLDAPLIFDDAENIGKVYFESELYAINSVDKMVFFSPFNKTEDIDFPLGIKLNGNNLANYGLYFDGGARLKFYNTSRIIQCNTNVYAPCNIASIDELEFSFLNVTGYKDKGIYFDCKNLGLGVKINYLFSNGCQNGGSNILHLSGLIRGFSCDKFMQVIGTPYLDVSDSNIKITPNLYGSCRLLTPSFGEIIIFNSKNHIIKALGNPDYKVSFTVNKITSMVEGTIDYKELILLDHCENTTLKNVIFSTSTKNYIEIRENCNNIYINNVDMKYIKKPCNPQNLWLNNEKYSYLTIPNDSVAKVYCVTNGLIKLTSNASNLYGLLMWNVADIKNLSSSDLINVTTGVLSGTTGEQGKLNISFSGNYIYIENRVGNQRNIILSISESNNIIL